MNYIMAFVLCVAGTIFSALGDRPDLYWLIISDSNVAIWLIVAYLLDGKRR